MASPLELVLANPILRDIYLAGEHQGLPAHVNQELCLFVDALLAGGGPQELGWLAGSDAHITQTTENPKFNDLEMEEVKIAIDLILVKLEICIVNGRLAELRARKSRDRRKK